MSPTTLDAHELADAVVRNNMGVGGIEFLVRARVDGEAVVIEGSGQRLPLLDGPAASSLPWLRLAAERFGAASTVVLRWRGEQAAPTVSVRQP
ncbi:MAG: hypothetical protein IT457_23035 [Planctomycetes bacterium]|nr:hypothetical protein [Planctomycetota bacterium]